MTSVSVVPGKQLPLSSFCFFLLEPRSAKNFLKAGNMPEPPNQGDPVAVTRAYDFVLWVLPKVEKFNRAYRFTVGERLAAGSLDILTLLVEAAYAARKDELLHDAIRKINSTRYHQPL